MQNGIYEVTALICNVSHEKFIFLPQVCLAILAYAVQARSVSGRSLHELGQAEVAQREAQSEEVQRRTPIDFDALRAKLEADREKKRKESKPLTEEPVFRIKVTRNTRKFIKKLCDEGKIRDEKTCATLNWTPSLNYIYLQ